MNINNFISSFGNFIIQCSESDVKKELTKEIIFEFLNNPNKYNDSEIIKKYLCEKLPINSYIQLISKLKL